MKEMIMQRNKTTVNGRHMMRCMIWTLCMFSSFRFATAQRSAAGWTAKGGTSKAFVENKGQFLSPHILGVDDVVRYAYDGSNTDILFTRNGVVFSLREMIMPETDPVEMEKEMRREQRRNQNITSMDEWLREEKRERDNQAPKYKYARASYYWEGANPNVEIEAGFETPDYFSYSFNTPEGMKNENFIKGYKRLTYKNLYPNIDVVYEFHPVEGIKYSLILHPGADIAKVKMVYSGNVELNEKGEIEIKTRLGNIIDHAPVTFYEGRKSDKIGSRFMKNGKTVSFSLDKYDATKTVVIDPWTAAPTFNTNWDCVWECETDAAGNSYLIGGVMPMQLLKYNSAGALQWTYSTPYDTTSWLGTFATDNAGNSYVTQGSVAAIIKVNNAGGLVWNNPNPGGIFASTEFWNIAFNCDQTKLVIGGTGGFLPPLPYIYNVDMATGNVTNSVQVTGSTIAGIPPNTQEVRSITATSNEKYYYLTHDSIGYVSQNLTLCPSQSAPFHINSTYDFGYKCEDWRYNNTGMEAIAYYGGFVYVHRGNRIDKRDFNTAAIVATAPIPGGSYTTVFLGGNIVKNSGITIDNCGNIYVGSINQIVKFNQNLTQLGVFPTSTPFNVYDVAITSTGDVVAAGSTGTSSNNSRTGYMQSFAIGACAQLPTTCCNPSICTVPNLCTTDPPVTLTVETPGGTWSGPAGLNTATGVFSPSVSGPGTFTITYTLACGSESITINVSACNPLNVCLEANGNLTASGGDGGPYTWQVQTTTTPCNSGLGNFCGPFTVAGAPITTWTTYATGNTTSPPASYPIQVLDGSGGVIVINSAGSLAPCTTTCPTLTVSASSQVNVACFGGATGSFNASTTGGASPYDYTLLLGATPVASFNNVAGAQPFSGLAAGTYTVNVVDNNGCPGTLTVTITQPASAVAASAGTVVNATCGNNNGSATVNGSGGTGSLSYAWNSSPVQNTQTATGLAPGTYICTVTDANGCTATQSMTVGNTGGPTGSIGSQTNVLCNGGTTGSATVNGSGGTGTLTYAWNTSPVQTGQTATGLPAGTYTCTITDGASCTGTVNVTITQPTAITITPGAVVDASCGGTNGSATVSATGGTGTLSYSWNTSPVQTGQTASGLAAGSYTCTVTDANGCTSTQNMSVNNVGGPSGSIGSQTNVLCNGGNTGSATVNGTGGTGTLTYSWNTSPVQTGQSASGLSAGTYVCTITDGASCTATVNVTITQPTAITITPGTVVNASCGNNNGSASVSASGGTGTLTYSWNTSPVQTGQTATGLAAGSYTCTVTDANGCSSTQSMTVNSASGPSGSVSSQTNLLCNGATTGSATVNGTGGTGTLTYSWNTSPVQTGQTANGLAAGTYTCTITDGASCTTSVTVTITAPAAIAITPGAVVDANCNSSNGSASVSATGGTGTLSYAWNTSPVQTGQTASGLPAGSYTCTVTDANGCTATQNITINNTGGPAVSLTTQTNVLCNGQTNGSATVNGTGGTGPLTYSWNTSPPQTGPGATGLAAGTYTVTVSDANNCQATLNVTITQPGAIGITPAVTPANCAQPDGAATVTVTGGTGPYSYSWTSGGTGATETNLSTGNYTVTVTDANGCTQSQSVVVTSVGSANINASPDQTIQLGGSANLTATGGTTYIWTPSTGLSCTTCPSPVASPTQTTTYIVTGTDANGCTGVDTVRVFVELPCGDLFFPTAFSPNGDGENDVWKVYIGNPDCIVSMEIRIFNRWGELVYLSTDPNEVWDGTWRGKMSEVAMYYFTFVATFVSGDDVDTNGTITLMK